MSLVESYSLEADRRARKERLARMSERAVPDYRQPVARVERVVVDFGGKRSVTLAQMRGKREAERKRAASGVLTKRQKVIANWCEREIRRLRRAIRDYESKQRRLAHGRDIDETVSEQANAIIAEVLTKHGLTKRKLLARPCDADPKAPRPMQEAAWRLYNEAGLRVVDIGKILGGRHHTTISHGAQRYQWFLDRYPSPKCKNCGKEFQADNPTRKFCSRSCSSTYSTRPTCEALAS